MKYFLLKDNLDVPGRWFLGPISSSIPFNFWRFAEVGPLEERYTDLSIAIRGNIVLDFTFSDFDIPVINDKVASLIPNNEVQLIPLKVGIFENFSILILLNELECVDEELSNFTKFTVNHPIRPDLAGDYEVIYKLVVDKSKCVGHSIFKIKGYSQYIIIDEDIKNRLETAHVRGITFAEV